MLFFFAMKELRPGVDASSRFLSQGGVAGNGKREEMRREHSLTSVVQGQDPGGQTLGVHASSERTPRWRVLLDLLRRDNTIDGGVRDICALV